MKIKINCFYCENQLFLLRKSKMAARRGPETIKWHNFCSERSMIVILVSTPRFSGVGNPFMHVVCQFECLVY